MSGIRGRNTKPEIAVRKALYGAGYRYRLHVRKLFGQPDIVIGSLRAVVFVHGCFWHRHARCKYAYRPKSNVVFWEQKFSSNVARDRLVRRKLRLAGWRVHVIWGCQVHERGLASLIRELRDKS